MVLYNLSVLGHVVHIIQSGGNNMKKSTLVVLIGGFIVITALLGTVSTERIYKKQKNFNSPEEVIQMIDSRPLLAINDGKIGQLKETEDFSECLSVRKRITDSDFNIAKLDIKEVLELDEKTENDLLNYYDNLRKRFSKRLPISREKAVRLKVNTYYIRNYRTGEMEKAEVDDNYQILDLVLIDEGEGYVIDFINSFMDDSFPDYSKIDEDGYIYYEGKYHGHDNMSDEDPSGGNISESDINSDEEVEGNA